MDVNQSWNSTEMLARLNMGDSAAADAVFERYVERLTRLARARLSPRLAARTDPEDVVLSAWRSFFVGARTGNFSLHRSGDLWRLLVSITMHKLYRQVRRHSAKRRAVGKEDALDVTPESSLPVDRREPTPEEVVSLSDELEYIMSQLDSFGRRVLELRLQGEQLAAIATDTGRAERTVRRTLEQLRKSLGKRLESHRDD